MNSDTKSLSCSECGVYNCFRRDKNFPDFCLTTKTANKEIEKVNELYRSDELVSKIAHAAAEIEGTYYGKLTRVEEIIAFAKKINAKKIGIATCIGLINEAKIFLKFSKLKGWRAIVLYARLERLTKQKWELRKSSRFSQAAMSHFVIRFYRQNYLTRKKQTLM